MLGLAAVMFMRFNYKRINKKRDASQLDREGETGRYNDKEMSEMGDRAPTFRYVL